MPEVSKRTPESTAKNPSNKIVRLPFRVIIFRFSTKIDYKTKKPP